MYKYDLHVHTSEVSPCGRVKAKEIARMYKKAGYQGIVITDHYIEPYFEELEYDNWEQKIEKYLTGYKEAYLEGQKIGLDVFWGLELRFQDNDNDYLAYGIDEQFLKENKELYKLDLEKFNNLIKGTQILIYQAHPFRSWCIRAKAQLLNGVEVFNGNPRHDSKNNQAYKFAKENDLLMISGSDFHEKEDLASSGIIISNIIKDNEHLLQCLKNIREENLIRK